VVEYWNGKIGIDGLTDEIRIGKRKTRTGKNIKIDRNKKSHYNTKPSSSKSHSLQ
jgi:hypothetical protein